MIQADIGENRSGTEVGFVTENGVADIVEVRDLRLVEDEAVLKLTGVPQHDAITDDDILTDVGAVANLASLADPSGSLDHGSVLDDRACSDINRSADEGLADQSAMNARLETELEVGRDLRKGLPSMGDILEDDTVFGAVEIE